MIREELLQKMLGSRVVGIARPNTVYSWNGGHTVNVYEWCQHEGTLREVTCMNVGSFENDAATEDEVVEALKVCRRC